jgi:hypothetical protein
MIITNDVECHVQFITHYLNTPFFFLLKHHLKFERDYGAANQENEKF